MQVEEFTPGLEKRVSQKSNIQGDQSPHSLSEHALERMQQRGISQRLFSKPLPLAEYRGVGGQQFMQ